MERIKTVEQLQKMLRNRGEGASYTGIFDWTFQTDFDWIIPYKEIVDNLLRLENGSLQLIRRFWLRKTEIIDGNIVYEDVDGLTNLSEFLRDVIKSREYELQKLINTLDLEYNPIDNVFEDTTETYRGDGTNTNKENLDSRSAQKANTTDNTISDMNYGKQSEKETTQYGERVDNSEITNTNKYGATGGETQLTNNVAPMDSDIFHSDTQSRGYNNTDEHTDVLKQASTQTSGSQNDSTTRTVDTRTDTNDVTKDVVNTTSYSSGTLKNFDGVTTTSYTKNIARHGNIGVTSSQELIRQEREIAAFSIYERIRQIFVDNFCMQLYADSVACETGEYYGDYFL